MYKNMYVTNHIFYKIIPIIYAYLTFTLTLYKGSFLIENEFS